MQHLKFEKIIDKLGSKYEAVVRMSVKARRIADGEIPEDGTAADKVSSLAMNEYLREIAAGSESLAEEKE